jgi:hypothetical protein
VQHIDGSVIEDSTSKGKTIEIFVNARPQGPDAEYIVTYNRAQHGNGSGSLAPGETVRVKAGTSFAVQFTTRS